LARATFASDTGFSPVGPPWIRDDHVSSTSFKVKLKTKAEVRIKVKAKAKVEVKGKVSH